MPSAANDGRRFIGLADSTLGNPFVFALFWNSIRASNGLDPGSGHQFWVQSDCNDYL